MNRSFLSLLGVAVLVVGGSSAHAADYGLSPAGEASPAVLAASTTTQQGGPAVEFIKSTAQRGLTFLSDPSSPQEKKKAEFRKLLDNSFDLDTIGRFVLGKYWNQATPAQRQEYSALFRKMVVEVYAGRFSDYKGQKFEVKSSRPVGAADTLVTSYIIPVDGGEPVQVDWRVRSKNGTYKIVDVFVAGVSMSVTQRSDFSSVIQRGGGDIAVLIDYLKQKF